MDIDTIINIISSEEHRKELVKELNNDVDIPFLNEKTEKKIINKLLDIIIKVTISKINNELNK